jgi:hypothetical protein
MIMLMVMLAVMTVVMIVVKLWDVGDVNGMDGVGCISKMV